MRRALWNATITKRRNRTLAIATAAVAAMTAIVTLTSIKPARAATSTTTVIDVQTGRCLDSNAEGGAATWACVGTAVLTWTAHGTTLGSTKAVTLVDDATGLCLDSNASGDVYTLPCNGGDFQYWLPETNAGAGGIPSETFVDDATHRCLDSNTNGNIYTLPCNEGAYQEWYITGPWPWCLANCTTAAAPSTTTTATVTTPPVTTTVTTTVPVPTTSTVTASPPKPRICAAPTHTGTLAFSTWIIRAHHRGGRARNVTILAGEKITVDGEVRQRLGTPVADTPICIGAIERGSVREFATTRADAKGDFQLTWRPKTSHRLRLVVGGSTIGATTDLRIAVRSVVTLGATPARLANGQTMMLRGQIHAPSIPRGLIVQLQAAVASGWQTFTTASTGAHGTFEARYRFTRTQGTQHYEFRARISNQLGYRYAVSVSRVVAVTVHGA
jgi:hypothetical protein